MSMLKKCQLCFVGMQIMFISGRKLLKNVETKYGVYFTKLGRQISGLLYDHFKHSFESIGVKGTELRTKNVFGVIKLSYS